MNLEDKNLFQLIGDWWVAKKNSAKKTTPSNRNKWLPTRGNVLFTSLVIGILFFVQNAGALTPQFVTNSNATTINYQGRLADSDGTALNGNYNIVFALYDSSKEI